MFFSNLSFFCFSSATAKKFNQIEELLAEHPLKPVGVLELRSSGFVPPMGRDSTAFSHRIAQSVWITQGSEQRLLPAAVVNEALNKKMVEIETAQARPLGGKARRQLKEDMIHEMLPKAFVRPARLNACVNVQAGFIAIDSSSRKVAEAFISDVRTAMGSFPALAINAEVSVRNQLTAWLSGTALPEGFELGSECELRDPVDQGAIIKCQRQQLQSEEIQKHLEAGKQVARLALTFNDRISFVIGDDLVIRKLKFLDGAVGELEGDNADSVAAELDARFALFSGELAELYKALAACFKFTQVD